MESPAHLDPASFVVAFSKQKREAMRLAREQSAAVKEMCRRAKSEMPPYTFEELIGKGAYGRVYKGFVYRFFFQYVHRLTSNIDFSQKTRSLSLSKSWKSTLPTTKLPET